jgi:hypothetical protein
MVYSALYTLSKAIADILVKILLARRRRIVKEKPREEIPRYGWFEQQTPLGYPESMYVGRYTALQVFIPHVVEATTGLVQSYKSKPPIRVYFTFSEAASKEWFKEIEALAKQAEQQGATS